MTRLDWKLRRIAAGYRQQDIAARIGLSSTRYSALERGEAEPKEWEMAAVEKLLPPSPQIVPVREPRRNDMIGNITLVDREQVLKGADRG